MEIKAHAVSNFCVLNIRKCLELISFSFGINPDTKSLKDYFSLRFLKCFCSRLCKWLQLVAADPQVTLWTFTMAKNEENQQEFLK